MVYLQHMLLYSTRTCENTHTAYRDIVFCCCHYTVRMSASDIVCGIYIAILKYLKIISAILKGSHAIADITIDFLKKKKCLVLSLFKSKSIIIAITFCGDLSNNHFDNLFLLILIGSILRKNM